MITQEEYNKYKELRDKINDLIIEKVNKLAMIQHGRLPIGDIVSDFEEEDEKILVQFERYICGDFDYESYKLPIEFLFDSEYPEKYKIIYEEENKKKEKKRKKKNHKRGTRKRR